MRRQQDEAVGRRQLEAVEIGRSATRRRADALPLRRARLRVVVREQRAAAGVPEHHDSLEAFLFAQKRIAAARSSSRFSCSIVVSLLR